MIIICVHVCNYIIMHARDCCNNYDYTSTFQYAAINDIILNVNEWQMHKEKMFSFVVNEACRCHLILRDRDQYMFFERCVGKGSTLIM